MGASISATYAYDSAANVAAPSAGAVADGQSGDFGTKLHQKWLKV